MLGSPWGLVFGAKKGSSGLLIKIPDSNPSQVYDKGIKEGRLVHRPLASPAIQTLNSGSSLPFQVEAE